MPILLIRDAGHVVLRLELLVVPILLFLVVAPVLALGKTLQHLIFYVVHVALGPELIVVPDLPFHEIARISALGDFSYLGIFIVLG